MYKENDYMTPRERINEELLQRSINNRQLPRYDQKPSCNGNDTSGAGAGKHAWGLENYPLASVYSPIQSFKNLYELDEALEHGTLFKELDLPFEASDSSIGGGCCGK